MSVIYLIRHGQASFGTDNYDQLSAVGREQSTLLGNYFAALGEPIDRIYTGTLSRQRETAQLIAAALGPAAPPLSVGWTSAGVPQRLPGALNDLLE